MEKTSISTRLLMTALAIMFIPYSCSSAASTTDMAGVISKGGILGLILILTSFLALIIYAIIYWLVIGGQIEKQQEQTILKITCGAFFIHLTAALMVFV